MSAAYLGQIPTGFRMGAIVRMLARASDADGFPEMADVLRNLAIMLETAGDRVDRIELALDMGELTCAPATIATLRGMLERDRNAR